MATGRTISATLLSEKDKSIISLCENISNILTESISDIFGVLMDPGDWMLV